VSGPFVGVNCGAIPESLVEAELFGSVRGAFSGAVSDRPGLVRQAHRGTLFLDEIADLPLASQAALLRVLQERRVRAVGAAESIPVELRVVSATNHDIEQRIRDGRFRQDLFARVAGYRIRLPPLRQRREDLGLLVGTLLPKVAPESARRLSLSVAAGRRLLDYDFPLNVRELSTWLAAAAALAEDDVIGLEHLPEPLELSEAEDLEDDGRPMRQLTADQERHRDEVRALLREHRGNVSAVARASGKARNQVQRWLKRYALDPNDFR
jgi:transcriptional regulator with PAS, ATPase and Fis domain